MRRASPAWKALGAFWVLVLAGAAGTGLVLHRLGPPEAPGAAAPDGPGVALSFGGATPPASPTDPRPEPPRAEPPRQAARPAERAPAPPSAAPSATLAGRTPGAAPAPNSDTPPAAEAPPAASAAPPPAPATPPAPRAPALAETAPREPTAPRPAPPLAERAAPSPALPAPPAAPKPPAGDSATAPEPPEPPASAIIADALPPAAAPEPLLAPPEAPAPPPLPPSATPPAASEVTIPAPDPALLETSPYGPLPRITTDGREARRLYARPFPAEEARPRIALVVGGFGLSPTRSEEALRRLPAATTLAFTPQAMRPDLLLSQARARGMEVALGLPLESAGAEPNEQTLRPGLMHWENQDRLHRALGRMAGYAGVIGAIGAQRGDRFAADRAQLEAVQEEAQARGLYYLEPRPGAPAPAEAAGAVADLILDEPLTRGEVERRLARLEEIARERGFALGLAAEPAPLLVDRIAAWAAGLEARGLVLAPASALTRPPGPAPSASR
ncbi:divergent polysaccharide deacetylase family protein [Pseudoroseomonas cervicalis]|uniref:divergent polysaccharide deacetylase family protein n=1 Tax=Teichococcus cervicalis TaxID=204525 RepID=UPI00277F455A|nr:divergent polysaccharide deacetylase family protein [Pseudoroseomonas cervicalis]MDQ1080102.1 polysaccharide deacetylase 2 family uncharacterized protein YibQ [Pseudoroseomonas cervicalis]